MNNTFDINRFGLLLQKDMGEYYIKLRYKIGVIFVAYAALMLFAWVIGQLSQGSQMNMDTRLQTMFFLTLVAIVSVPANLYGHVNHKQKGIGYAMLPASSLEKFLTMVIMAAIVTPILSIFSLLTIDTILSYLPLGNDATVNVFTSEIRSIGVTAYWCGDLIITSCTFLLGNMIFKRSKISKTLLSIIIVWVVVIIIAVIVGFIGADFFSETSTSLSYIESAESFSTWFKSRPLISRILLGMIYYLSAITVLYFTYRKIKTQQY